MDAIEIARILLGSTILVAVGNGLKWLYLTARENRNDRVPFSAVSSTNALTDRSMAVLKAVNERLEGENARLIADNTRVYERLAKTEAALTAERDAHEAREAKLKQEVTRLEQRVRELEAAVRGVSADITSLRTREFPDSSPQKPPSP